MRSSILLLLVACSETASERPDGGGVCNCPTGTFCSVTQTCIADGTCADDADCTAGMRCGEDRTCSIGGCGGTLLDLTSVAPNMLLVLDRSCSMRAPLASTTTSKWVAAVGALQSVLADYATDVRWGLTMFPDKTNEACAQDAIPFPVGAANAGPISATLTSALATTDPLYPSGPCVTNIDTAIEQAATDPGLADPSRESYLMLISDGAQSSCNLGGGDAGTEAAIADLYTNRGIPTFVVGFGSATDAAELNKLAMLGGRPLAGTPRYYQADTAAQLDQAFQSIAGLVATCTFKVDPPPADLMRTYVFFDKTELVPHDPGHTAGWDYNPSSLMLTVYGSYCSRLEAKQVSDIDVVFGCPSPPIL